jgi:hypothetical protein
MSLSPSVLHHALCDALEAELAFTADDPSAWRRRLRAELSRLLGLQHIPPNPTPRAPRRLWARTIGGHAVEKLVLSSEPGVEVPAYLAIPAGVPPPHRVMICLQGHTSGMHNSLGLTQDESHEVEIEGGRDYARQALARGWAALCIEQRSLGERAEREQERVSFHNSCHDAAMHALLLGRTLLGERVYDVDRALDHVATRPELDSSRIGIMGNSGGGTVAIWAGALLDRIGFVMPSCSLCSFRASLMSIYHCADNYVPGILRVCELADVAGLVAPRPLCAVTGTSDPIFPLDGVRECFAALERIYAAHGAADRAELVIGPEGHRFYPELAWPVADRLLASAWG